MTTSEKKKTKPKSRRSRMSFANLLQGTVFDDDNLKKISCDISKLSFNVPTC